MLSITVVCYNKWETIKQAFDKLRRYKQSEIVAVDNHPPYKDASKNIKAYCKKEGFKYIDAGKNIGCHQGYNLGFKEARGDFLVKNNDSIMPPEESDLIAIENFLKRHKDFAYLSINFRDDYFKGTSCYKQRLVKKEGFEIAIMESGVVNFACVVIPKRIFKELGELKPLYTKANGVIVRESKYGGEEPYYQSMASANNYKTGTVLNMKVERIPDDNFLYTAWKYGYGFLGIIDCEFEKFKEDSNLIRQVMHVWLKTDNDYFEAKAEEWLKLNA